MRTRIFLILVFFGVFGQAQTSRLSIVLELVEQATRILPENWFIVHSDTNCTIYFCETALDLPLSDTNAFVNTPDLFGDQFWGVPRPDSIYVSEFDQPRGISKGTKYTKGDYSQKKNAILRIDLFVGGAQALASTLLYNGLPVYLTHSVPLNYTINFTENRKPVDCYYRPNGLTLTAEYRRLVLNLKFMLGEKNPQE